MVISLTYRCSMGCPHCMLSCVPTGESMSIDTLKNAVGFFKETKRFALMVSGGEPTEHPQFLQCFNYILKRVKGERVFLLTNGQWLLDSKLLNILARLQKKHRFNIQVSSMPDLYPRAEEVIDAYAAERHRFNPDKIYLETKITSIDYFGRAKGKDFSHLGELYKKKAPSCFNLFSFAKGLSSMPEVMQFLDHNVNHSRCIPMIDARGDIYPGECAGTGVPAGNVNSESSLDDAYQFLRNNMPCGNCGIKFSIPMTVKR